MTANNLKNTLILTRFVNIALLRPGALTVGKLIGLTYKKRVAQEKAAEAGPPPLDD